MSRKVFLACSLACLLPVGVLAETGTVTRAAQLAAEPFVDAASRGVLPRETIVEVTARDGGWYQVRADDGREGWVRLSSIRLGEVKEEESGGFWASLFSFTGRSQARTASATTGIRGLSETEIRDAHADPAAVARVAAFAPDDAEARRFAAEIGLEARVVPALPEEIKLANADGGGQ